MKKGFLVLAVLAMVLSAYSFHFFNIRDTLKESVGDFVAFKGRVSSVDMDQRIIVVKDKTGTLRVQFDNRALDYMSEERWGTEIRVWGHLKKDRSGYYVKGRRIRLFGTFYYNENQLH